MRAKQRRQHLERGGQNIGQDRVVATLSQGGQTGAERHRIG